MKPQPPQTGEAGDGPPRMHSHRLAALLVLISALTTLTGCLEQLQSPRSAAGAMTNFYLHLKAGELDDARAYMAPGLVDLTPELDAQIQEASERLRAYEIEREKPVEEELTGAQKRVTLPGRIRPQHDSFPVEEWQQADILTATMVERGPGWRILEFELTCCPEIPNSVISPFR